MQLPFWPNFPQHNNCTPFSSLSKFSTMGVLWNINQADLGNYSAELQHSLLIIFGNWSCDHPLYIHYMHRPYCFWKLFHYKHLNFLFDIYPWPWKQFWPPFPIFPIFSPIYSYFLSRNVSISIFGNAHWTLTTVPLNITPIIYIPDFPDCIAIFI